MLGAVPPEDYADNFFDFRDSLTALFQRKIDLVEVQTLKNPYFKQIVEKTKQPVLKVEVEKLSADRAE